MEEEERLQARVAGEFVWFELESSAAAARQHGLYKVPLCPGYSGPERLLIDFLKLGVVVLCQPNLHQHIGPFLYRRPNPIPLPKRTRSKLLLYTRSSK